MHNQSQKRFQLETDSRVVVVISLLIDDPPFLQHNHQFNHHCYLFLFQLPTFTVPPVWKQPVAARAGAVVRARDVHALVDAELPSMVQPVHFTLVNICQNSPGLPRSFRKMARNSASLLGHLQYHPARNNFWKTPCLKRYSTTYILRAGKL